MHLHQLGWNNFFEASLAPHSTRGLIPGRVFLASHEIYRLATAEGELRAELTGSLRYRAESALDLPAVGDWVAVRAFPGDDGGVIDAILPRASALVRRAAGTAGQPQLIAANVDTVFIVTSANQDLNPRRLERYLAFVTEGGAKAVIVLSKADLVSDPRTLAAELQRVAPDTPILVTSSRTEEGISDLAPFLGLGQTVALVGSSGVGKSSLVNRLLGEERQAVQAIREADDRGKHATTHRELFALPGGALLLDTPGLRELGLWDAGEGLAAVFDDIAALATSCRFGDCKHQGEPGCAVREAVDHGTLDAGRLESYHKLEREQRYRADRDAGGAAYAERKRWKAIHSRAR